MPTRQSYEEIDANADGAAIWGNQQAEHSQSSFSSAVKRNETTPSKRRRGSDGLAKRGRTDHDPWAEADMPTASSHSRARTTDDGASTSQHPLRLSSGVASSSAWTLDHETRPTMRRMLSDRSRESAGGSADDEGRERRDETVARDREMLVIVHEVQPKDSLAGMALKYGITLAELRRANQLWTSDSIHLRKVLYIPVDKTRHAKHLREALIETFMATDALPPSVDQSDTPGADNIRLSSTNHDLPDIGKLTLRRIPASQLTYFPPSSHSHASSRLDQHTDTSAFQISTALLNGKASRSRPALPGSFTRSTDSPLQGVLDVFSSSFQTTANHVRASTGGLFGAPAVRAPPTLVARLSLESNSGTPSSPSDDLDWEHEMEDVSFRSNHRRNDHHKSTSHTKASGTRSHAKQASASLNDLTVAPAQGEGERDSVELESGPFRPSSPHTPTRRHRRSSSGRSQSQHAHTPSSTGSRGRGRPAVPYAEADAELVTAEWGSPKGRGASVVRTAQMEPSPGMQLPVRQRSAAKASGS
ncbi:carbohydrate-binding module family 50 protein [Polyporus arcularius HHB13444]|uniref:Carbohydrate-binding module family 50 protein n=1 Tax=Polyporus arcularius HHB13444 TaxID=1314778 RepID=A0A5C3NXE1_9APHY|nr:carbohydrate-binding module family 50 protein [Polyporus arcularius HHB13444]